jgi:dTDP-4-amino-4,6-dideoxygalactose transaminase
MGFDPNEPQVYDSNFWLCTITLDPKLRIKGQENAYKQAITGAVGGAAGVIHLTDSTTTDCQPNANVEALRLFMNEAQIEARPLWKPMHKQPVFKKAPAYVNGVSEALFKVGVCLPAGPWVGDEEVRYIVSKIKEAIDN